MAVPHLPLLKRGSTLQGPPTPFFLTQTISPVQLPPKVAPDTLPAELTLELLCNLSTAALINEEKENI